MGRLAPSGIYPIGLSESPDRPGILASDQGPAEGLNFLADIAPTAGCLAPLSADRLVAATTPLVRPAVQDHLDGLAAIQVLEVRQTRRRRGRDDEQEPTDDSRPAWRRG